MFHWPDTLKGGGGGIINVCCAVLQLESKTVRFRDEQLERVAQVAKRLRRAQKLKARESGRITDNTLIRVAVDFMLAHAHKLVGETEPELLESLHKQTEEGRPV